MKYIKRTCGTLRSKKNNTRTGRIGIYLMVAIIMAVHRKNADFQQKDNKGKDIEGR